MLFMKLNDDSSEKVTYDYTDYPIYIKKAFLSLYPDYTALAHWHDDIELIYILSGEMQYNINGKIVNLMKDEGIFVNSRQMHFGFSEKHNECEFICIRLHPILLCANSAYETNYVLPVLNNTNANFILLNRKYIWQNEIIDIILTIGKTKNVKTAPIKILGLFFHLWALIFDNIMPAIQDKQKNTDFFTLKNMLKFIQQNYSEKISLSEIAKSGMVGESKCCKLFSTYIGQTPNTYLTNYRLQKSMNLLKNTDMTVLEIALNSGFGGSSYFSEIFRKKYKISPSKYRATHKI